MIEYQILNSGAWCQVQRFNQILSVYYPSSSIQFKIDSIQTALNPEFWNKLKGAFAAVIVDQHSGEIVLVRDHLGCEPLYYFWDQKRLIFGSKLPDILEQLDAPSALNTAQVLDLFTFSQQYSDETFYQSINRVEPGHLVYLHPQRSLQKIPFWQLDRGMPDIILKNDKAYLERFSELMHESVRYHTENVSGLAAEFSGGLDSSAILATAYSQHCHYPLFMHIADPEGKSPDDRHLADCLLSHLKLPPAHYISAEHFDPLAALKFCAYHFAGAAPYIFFMLANNIHQAVANQGCKVLLSGGGGDECVSSHAPLQAFLPNLIKKGTYQTAWQELVAGYRGTEHRSFMFLKRCERFLKYAHPFAFKLLASLEDVSHFIRKYLEWTTWQRQPVNYYPSVRDYEWKGLQGPNSHPLRMRLEYSAVIAKALGFEYRYPLLYPPLLEFCFGLPVSQKRRNGMSRYLMRTYLAQHVPMAVYSKRQKIGGIAPGTFDKCRRYLVEGHFKESFQDLPYAGAVHCKNELQYLAAHMYAYMFNILLGLKNLIVRTQFFH